jgi:hypothetical protein
VHEYCYLVDYYTIATQLDDVTVKINPLIHTCLEFCIRTRLDAAREQNT